MSLCVCVCVCVCDRYRRNTYLELIKSTDSVWYRMVVKDRDIYFLVNSCIFILLQLQRLSIIQMELKVRSLRVIDD